MDGNVILRTGTINKGLLLICLIGNWPKEASAAPKTTGRTFENVVRKIEANFEPTTARRGQTVTWKLSIQLAPGWHTYPTVQEDPAAQSQHNDISFPPGQAAIFVGDLKEPLPETKAEPALNIKSLRYYEGKAVWERPAVVNPKAQPGAQKVRVSIRLLVCDVHNCLPPKSLIIDAPLSIDAAEPMAVDARFSEQVNKLSNPSAPGPHANTENNATIDQEEPAAANYMEELQRLLNQMHTQATPHTGLLAFLMAGVFWGGVSLVTPCVFPMIPITVSFFLKQSEKATHRPVLMASVYCLTIVTVLTFAAVVLLSFFRLLSVNPIMNFGLGGLFVFFALSLFGMYDIELPSGMARFTAAREGKGGLAGTMFMALTFTIVSFACVAPFLGGFGGTASTSQLSTAERILGGLAFSITFAAPFFVLALFPSLLKKMPKSGSWLNSVKVVMGFLELAAALKFFRAGELVLLPTPTFFTYDFVLGLWVALSLLAGLYLINVYRLPYDTPSDHISVPRLFGGFIFIGLAFYLAPALLKYNAEGETQRPNGTVYAWVDSFLLPEPKAGKTDLQWNGDLKAAIDESRAYRMRTGKRQLVFVDFTGETCTNCKINENTVFSKSDIKEIFKAYKLVQLFTDKVPNWYYPAKLRDQWGSDTSHQRADARANLWFQKEAFGTEQLPLYVILEPLSDGKIEVAGVYAEGKINNEAAFADFLKKPLASDLNSQVTLRR